MQLPLQCISVKLARSILVLLALYVSGFASATTEAPAALQPAPHIALLLPLNSPSLGAAAEAVHQGILAAAGTQAQRLPVLVYSDFDDTHSIVDTYRTAIKNGAVAVLGPLTRDKIRQLANETGIPVPTLALNVIEGQAPPQMYFFGLAVEAEAQQIALLARKQGLKQAIVISADRPLSRRLQYAFEEQWSSAGGSILREVDFSGDTSAFSDIIATPDTMVFFATDAEKSRTIRPFLPAGLAAYGTSQIFPGNNDALANFDLEGLHFVDMPWLLQSDQPSAYPRSAQALTTDQERLYALGIDAYRLIQVLLAGQASAALPMDGVTGILRLNNQTFTREALPALFVQGHAQSADAPVAPAVQVFPGLLNNASPVIAASSVAAAAVKVIPPARP